MNRWTSSWSVALSTGERSLRDRGAISTIGRRQLGYPDEEIPVVDGEKSDGLPCGCGERRLSVHGGNGVRERRSVVGSPEFELPSAQGRTQRELVDGSGPAEVEPNADAVLVQVRRVVPLRLPERGWIAVVSGRNELGMLGLVSQWVVVLRADDRDLRGCLSVRLVG